MFPFVLAALLPLAAAAQPFNGCAVAQADGIGSAGAGNAFFLWTATNEALLVHMRITTGFSLSLSLGGDDLWIIRPWSENCAQDAHLSADERRVTDDASQDLLVRSCAHSVPDVKGSAHNWVELERKWDTGDRFDAVLSPGGKVTVRWWLCPGEEGCADSNDDGRLSGSWDIAWSDSSHWDERCDAHREERLAEKPVLTQRGAVAERGAVCSLSLPPNATDLGNCSSLPSGTESTCFLGCASGTTAVAGLCNGSSWIVEPLCNVSFPTPSLSHCIKLSDSFFLYWDIVGQKMEFETLSWGYDGYVSFGPASSSSVVIFHAGGSVVDIATIFPPGSFCADGCIDSASASISCISRDSSSKIENQSVVYQGGKLFSHFVRNMTATDSGDVSLVASGNKVFWAVATDQSVYPDYAEHSDRGAVFIDWSVAKWDSGCGSSTAVSSSSAESSSQKDACTLDKVKGSFTAHDGVFKANWSISSDLKSLDFTMTGRTTGWICLGFNTQCLMRNSDKYTGWVSDSSSEVVLIDSWCTGRVIPKPDTEFGGTMDANNISGWQNSTHTTINFRRALDTGDTYDRVLNGGSLYLLWALAGSDGQSLTFYSVHGSSDGVDYGCVEVNLMSCTDITEASRIKIGSFSNAAQAIIVTLAAIVGAICVVHLGFVLFPKLLARPRPNSVGTVVHLQVMQSVTEAEPIKASQDESAPPSPVTSSSSSDDPAWSAPEVVPRSRWRSADGLLGTRVFHGLSVSWLFFFVVLVVVNVAWLAAWIVRLSDKYQRMEAAARALGHLSSVALFITVIPSTRNSVLCLLLGQSFERMLLFHRWIAYWSVAVVALHMVIFFAARGSDIIVLGSSVVKAQVYGLVALACGVVLVATSMGKVRRSCFSLFFFLHYAFIPFFVFAALHNAKFRPFLWASLAVWGADRVLRMVWAAQPCRVFDCRLMLENKIVRVRWRKPPLFVATEPGQYVFVNFPLVNPIEWHPFTLCNGPRERLLEINVKALGKHTNTMVSRLPKKQSLWLRADGPYGKHMVDLKESPVLLLLSVGIGVTPVLSLLRDIFGLARNEEGEIVPGLLPPSFGKISNVVVHTGQASAQHYTWFEDTTEAIFALKQKPEGKSLPSFSFHVHLSKGSTEGVKNAVAGRMEAVGLIRKTMERHASRMVVFVCGPEPLVNSAWDEVSRMRRRGLPVDIHYETFLF